MADPLHGHVKPSSPLQLQWTFAIELHGSWHAKEEPRASKCQCTLSPEKLMCPNATKYPFQHPPAVSPGRKFRGGYGWFGNVWAGVPARLATPGPQIQSQTRICVSQRTQQRGCRPTGTDSV